MGEPLIQSREHISVELLPSNGPQDQSRFQADVAHVSDLIRGKTAHTFVTTSLPYFPRPVVYIARTLRTWLQKSDFLKKVSGEHRDLIVSLLAEMTHRQPSHTVGPLEADVESRHIRTMPAQMYDWRTLQDHLRHLQDPAGLFVVSGGHPLRKIQKTLEIYDFHIAWLDYLLHGGLGQVDVREFMSDVQNAFPQKPLLGAWNYHTDTPGRIAGKVRHGMQGMISQPASFMPDTFHRALMDLRSVPEGREIPILVGLPHVTSVTALKFWFILMNIIPEKHPEAAYILENFQRAKKDGYVGAFSDQFTRHCIEWALALPGTAGIHFMGSKGESFELLRDVLGVNQKPNGFGELSYQIATEFHREEVSYSQNGFRLVASPGLYSSEKKPKNTGQYAHELLSLLSPVREVIANIQQQFENHPFWNNTEIHFIRRSANNHAHTLPVEVITSDDGQIHEIRIDVRYDYKNDKINILLSLVQDALKAHLLDEKAEISDIEIFDTGHERSSLLERLQRDGWSWFGDLQKARGETGDAGTETAKKPEIIDISAHNILTALLEAEDQSEYVILESGAWHANGIPEILEKMETTLPDHPQERVLRERLKRTKYVCVDIAVEGVESCEKVLGKNHRTLGISYEYQVCDLMDDMSVRGLHDKYKGKVIFARSINVLDALQNRQYVERRHNIYEMSYQTGILRKDLEHICHSSFEYFDDEGKKTLSISLDIEGVVQHFRHSRSNDGNEVSTFLAFLEMVYHIPQKAGLVIFEKILQAMKKCHSYHHDLRKDSIAHRVAAYHPDPQSPFTDSHQTTHCVNSLVDMLCPGGRALFFQLQRDVVALHRSAHNTNTTPTTYHITPCFPVSIEAVEVVAHQKKFVTHILSGASFRLPSSSGGVLIYCPK